MDRIILMSEEMWWFVFMFFTCYDATFAKRFSVCIQILSQRRLPKHCLINTDFLLLVKKLWESDGSQISPVPTFPAHPKTLKPGRWEFGIGLECWHLDLCCVHTLQSLVNEDILIYSSGLFCSFFHRRFQDVNERFRLNFWDQLYRTV